MARKRIRVYADTSVFGGVFDEEFAKASRIFFDQVRAGDFDLVLSPVVEGEIAEAPEKIRSFYESVAAIAETLPLTEEAIHLRDAYLEAGIVGPQWAADALHVAHATTCGCRMIVSWNFEHIVHYEKVALYNAINIREGCSPIAIHSPQEVIKYESQSL
ncbi:hypothetical protein AMJ85_05525 [candidate division BRC1 bacterium SM23_51]|nr:MAG: hypothetical protein AMJ85_05525 [candidate division BRC1 bacterium SM23_51]